MQKYATKPPPPGLVSGFISKWVWRMNVGKPQIVVIPKAWGPCFCGRWTGGGGGGRDLYGPCTAAGAAAQDHGHRGGGVRLGLLRQPPDRRGATRLRQFAPCGVAPGVMDGFAGFCLER